MRGGGRAVSFGRGVVSAGLRARLRRLEATDGRQDAPREGPLVVLPVGLAAEDADAFIAHHRQRTGWSGTVVVLPSNIGHDPKLGGKKRTYRE